MTGEAMAEEEEEYESDPDEAKLSLKFRRREASDDEEEAEIAEGEERGGKLRRSMESDLESNGQGGAAEYQDELEEEEEQEYYEEDEYAEEEIEEEEEKVEYEERGGGGGKSAEIKGGVERDIKEEERHVKNDSDEIRNDNNVNDGQEEEKVIEPYAVPTAGAFYMHDDRFRDNVGGRNRRTLGGRKLWESKDTWKWGHDKFEELTMQERHYEDHRRTSRGRHRGRVRNRGTDLGYTQEQRPKAYNNNNNQNSDNNQSFAPKGVRGRGPRRYQPTFGNNNEGPRARNKQSGKLIKKPSHVSSGRTGVPVSKVEPDANQPRKQVFASNLSITSPPFYPSGSSTKENISSHRRDLQAGTSRNVQSSPTGESFSIAQSATMLQGKDTVDSIGMNKLYIDGSLSTVAGKPSNTLQVLPSSSSSNNSTQPLPLRSQGRGANSSAQMAYKPVVSNNQVNRASPPTQLQTVHRNPVQSWAQSSFHSSGQQLVQRFGGGSQTSPPKAVAINSFEPVELESSSDLSKSKTALVAKGKGSVQGGGGGSFLYSGAQVMGAPGNVGSGNGDQNFPAFLPVMQFGGQHPGGVPAVGMAFPGYVAQPQLGLGNSEMTWLPVLAGAAGALGTTFGSPYLSLDGSYNARHPSGQTSSVTAASSKENNATKVDDDGNPTHRPELTNDDFGQRQKNPRRYTEMKFDK